MNKNVTEKQAMVAEFPDDTEIAQVVDHGVFDVFHVQNADPEYYYYLAADDGDKDRPDGVHQIGYRGYEVCERESVKAAGGSRLMRIPLKDYVARRKARRAAREAASNAQKRPRGIPDESLVQWDERGGGTKDGNQSRR